jgi:type II secretory pathway component PulL
VITSEELRVNALAASAKRGKWVARRRIFGRWLGWAAWRIVLPAIGLVAVVAALVSIAFWQYMGHDAAYVAVQQWVQQEFGSFKATASVNNTVQTTNNNNPPQSRSENTSMINLTDEATPDLQLDRNLTIKTSP